MRRRIYAIREGSYKGNFFVYIGQDDKNYNFLCLPDNEPVEVPKEKFNKGIQEKIVDYIEKLPHNVYEICCAQYNESKAKQNINRLKQSTTPSGVDNRKRSKKN
jgi:hypothetical protein